MKTFIQWAEEKRLDLPLVTDTEKHKGQKQEEKRSRTGIRPYYPAAYYNSQYADLGKPPISASAPVDLSDKPQFPDKADVGNSPLK